MSGYHLVEHAGEMKHRIYFKQVGNKNARHRILFSMGLGGDHLQWEPQVHFFAEQRDDFQVCVYDNRGIGFSDPVDGRWTTKLMARDALSLLDHLNWTSEIHVVGLSMGGMITQELALLDFKRFASMTLVSTHSGGLHSLLMTLRNVPVGLKTLATTFLSSDPNERLKSGLKLLYPEEFLDKQTYNEEKGEHEHNFRKFRRALIKRGMEGKELGMPSIPFSTVFKQALAVTSHRVSYDSLAKLGQHFGPGSLVITGGSDILVHHDCSKVLKKGLNAKLIVLDDAGHGANEQHAETVNNAILEAVIQGQKFYQHPSRL